MTISLKPWSVTRKESSNSILGRLCEYAAVKKVKMFKMFHLTGVGGEVKKHGQHFLLVYFKISKYLTLSARGRKLILVE